MLVLQSGTKFVVIAIHMQLFYHNSKALHRNITEFKSTQNVQCQGILLLLGHNKGSMANYFALSGKTIKMIIYNDVHQIPKYTRLKNKQTKRA